MEVVPQINQILMTKIVNAVVNKQRYHAMLINQHSIRISVNANAFMVLWKKMTAQVAIQISIQLVVIAIVTIVIKMTVLLINRP